MNPQIVRVVLAAILLSSVAAAVTTYAILAPGADAEEMASKAAVPEDVAIEPGRAPELLARIDELTMANQTLLARLESLEQRPISPQVSTRTPVGEFVTKQDFEDFQSEMRGALSNQPEALAEPVELKDQVASSLAQIRKEEKVTAVRDYQEKRSARLDQDVERMTEWLELEPYQADELRGILTVQYEREDAQRVLWEDGASDEVLAERKRTDGTQFWLEVEGAFSAEQYETFREYVQNRGK